MRKTILVAVALAATGWLAWPYYAVYRITKAVDEGDTVKLEQYVSWPSVRQGIKDDLNAVLAYRLANDPEASGAVGGLGAILLPAAINQMVDSYMTASGLAELLRARRLSQFEKGVLSKPEPAPAQAVTRDKKHDREREELSQRIKYAFFEGPLSFLVVLGKPNSQDDLKVLMRFEELSWKITRVFLPVAMMKTEGFETSGKPNAIKVPPPPLNLGLLNVRYDWISDGGHAVLRVTGNVANNGINTVSVPPLTIMLLNGAGEVISEWPTEVKKSELSAGETTSFVLQIPTATDTIRSVKVRFRN